MTRTAPFLLVLVAVVMMAGYAASPAYGIEQNRPQRVQLLLPKVHYEKLIPGQVVAFRLNGPRAALRRVTTDGIDPRGKVQILEGTGSRCEVGTRIRLVLRARDYFESADNRVPITRGAGLCARLIGGEGVTGVYVLYTEKGALPFSLPTRPPLR